MSTWQWILVALASLILGFVFGAWYGTATVMRKFGLRELIRDIKRDGLE